MDSEKIAFWVKLVLAIVSTLLGANGQVQLARTLLDKHDAW